MNKIKLVLLLSTVCMTMHAGNWFGSLKKTVDRNRGYTALAVVGLSAGAYLWSKRPRAVKRQVPIKIRDTADNKAYIEKQWRVFPTNGVRSPIGLSSLGSFALGLGALGKLGYEWWRSTH